MASVLLQVATFLSAFLLFVIQPLYAKHLLPFFGGTATVWTISIFFYSVTLLLGYIYASFLTEWKVKGVGFVHGILLAAATFLLIDRYFDGVLLVDAVVTTSPAVSVLLTLLFAVGLPVLLLASTSVITQRLHARIDDGEPYRLYAVSNTGSVLGLLSYPFLIEPFSGVSFQIAIWMGLFAVFSFVLLWSWYLTTKNQDEVVVLPSGETGRSINMPLKILGLAAIPTFLLATGTEYMSQGIASFPLLWVVPLTFYLLSFVIAFSDRYAKYTHVPVQNWALYAAAPLVLVFLFSNVHSVLFWLAFVSFVTFFFLVSIYFHRELYNMRPRVAELGRFYVLMTAGGALGSGCVGLLLPLILNDNTELAVAIGALTVYFTGLYFKENTLFSYPGIDHMIKISAISTCVIFVLFAVSDTGTLVKERNFYGTLHVLDIERYVDGEPIPVRALANGATAHGFEALDEAYRGEAASYYGPDSGIDVAIRSFTDAEFAPRVMVVGLGAGMINAYCDELSHISYIEINPTVVDIAYEYFSYLDMCSEKNDIRVGDGRLVLEGDVHENREGYDVIMIDAFTDDAIPAHLLTTEAFRDAYEPLLNSNGVLAVHTSNKYLNLSAPIAGIAEDNGYVALRSVNFPDGNDGLQMPTSWMLIASKEKADELIRYETVFKYDGERVVWTDDRHSILGVLSFKGSF